MYETDGLTVISLAVSLQHRISVTMDLLCDIVLNRTLLPIIYATL